MFPIIYKHKKKLQNSQYKPKYKMNKEYTKNTYFLLKWKLIPSQELFFLGKMS